MLQRYIISKECKRNGENEYQQNDDVADLHCVPVHEADNYQKRHEYAGYYGFNIYVKHPEGKYIKYSIERFHYRISRRDRFAAAVTFASQHQPAEYGDQINRTYLCAAFHAVRGFLFFSVASPDSKYGLSRRQSVDNDIQETSYRYSVKEDDRQEHYPEHHGGVFTV